MPNYGYDRIAVPEELTALLDRMTKEYGWPSRRAAIEALIVADSPPHEMLREDDEHWPEWIDAVEASRTFNLESV